jgi:hypothetical protein
MPIRDDRKQAEALLSFTTFPGLGYHSQASGGRVLLLTFEIQNKESLCPLMKNKTSL